MAKKTLPSSKEYSYYEFEPKDNPFFFIFSRKKQKKFVYAELEKRHPFFGSHCTVDYKLTIHNKKLYVKASVIDTIAIANTKRPIKAIKLAYCSIFVVLFVTLLCTCLVPFDVQEPVEPVLTVSKLDMPCTSMKSFLLSIEDLLGDDVTCTSLTFTRNSLDANTDISTVKIDLVGVFPETLVSNDIQISEVHFENNIPSLSVSFSEKNTIDSTVMVKATSDSYLSNSVIRNLILDSDGIVHKENISKKLFEFSMPVSKWDDFFKNSLLFFSENLLGVSKISLRQVENSINATIELHNSFQNSQDLYIKNLFKETKIPVVAKSPIPIIIEKKENSSVQSTQIEKIGSITRSDGAVVVFQLNKEGKIISEEKK